jgi:hypothetical protein
LPLPLRTPHLTLCGTSWMLTCSFALHNSEVGVVIFQVWELKLCESDQPKVTALSVAGLD